MRAINDKLRRHRAFTITELLVVTGIIILITTIFLPVMAGARQRARQVVCASNLRQLCHTYFAYADRNDSRFPYVSGGQGDLYLIANRDEMVKNYGLTEAICNCPATQVWPRTDATVPFNWTSPLVEDGYTYVPVGYTIFLQRTDGYHWAGGTDELGIPPKSLYRTLRDRPLMRGGNTPTPLLACYALDEGAGLWNAKLEDHFSEPTPMHGLSGINCAQVDGSVFFKPYPGHEIFDDRGDAEVLKFVKISGTQSLAY